MCLAGDHLMVRVLLAGDVRIAGSRFAVTGAVTAAVTLIAAEGTLLLSDEVVRCTSAGHTGHESRTRPGLEGDLAEDGALGD